MTISVYNRYDIYFLFSFFMKKIMTKKNYLIYKISNMIMLFICFGFLFHIILSSINDTIFIISFTYRLINGPRIIKYMETFTLCFYMIIYLFNIYYSKDIFNYIGDDISEIIFSLILSKK